MYFRIFHHKDVKFYIETNPSNKSVFFCITQYLMFILSILSFSQPRADIYKCVNPEGIIDYHDKPSNKLGYKCEIIIKIKRRPHIGKIINSKWYTPTREEEKKADYGLYPNNYENLIKAYMGNVLHDPYSAHYDFYTPTEGYTLVNKREDLNFCYTVKVIINAKNLYGAFTGNRLYFFDIKNHMIVGMYDKGRPK